MLHQTHSNQSFIQQNYNTLLQVYSEETLHIHKIINLSLNLVKVYNSQSLYDIFIIQIISITNYIENI